MMRGSPINWGLAYFAVLDPGGLVVAPVNVIRVGSTITLNRNMYFWRLMGQNLNPSYFKMSNKEP